MKILLRTLFSMCVLPAAVGPAVRAQDVTVSAPAWFLPDAAPDELPKPKTPLPSPEPNASAPTPDAGEPVWFTPDPEPERLPTTRNRLRPGYPSEMRKTDEMGYVIVTRYIDREGKSRSVQAEGTHIPFQRAVEEELRDWELRPAQRGGVPVDARFWVAVIFNPKSASTSATDAQPRLLEVTPVLTPMRPVPKNEPPVVHMRLHLDEQGAIVDASLEGHVNNKAVPLIKDALKHWRFAPARKAGQPVAAEIVVPVLCQRTLSPDLETQTPPQVVKQTRPVYPSAMRANRLRGQVTIDFVVDENGHVQDPIVSQSSNPAFDSPALEALQKWTFKPATRAGKPVKAKMRVPILFALERDGVLEGEDLYRVEAEDMSKLPPEYQFDTAPKPRGTVAAVYPYELLREHVSGKAKVVCLIDARGKVVQVNVTSASKPEFGQALAAAFESFEFDPALNKGKPTATLLAMEKEFLLSTNNPFAAVVPTSVDFELLALEKKSPEKIRKLTELDAPLKPISRRSPVFPRAVAESVRTGEALVEFLIDEEGKARLPRIVSASEPAFGYAAAQAVSQWQFEPPKCAGKTVVVRARIPLKFDGGAAPAAKVAASEKPSEPAQ